MNHTSRRLDRFPGRAHSIPVLVTIALLVVDMVTLPDSVGLSHLPATLGTLAPFVIAGLASTPAILCGGGGIDLSIAPLMGLVDIVLATKLLGTPLGGPAVAIPILLVLGAAVGTLNGLLITKVRYPPVIATLGMYFILSALDLQLAPQPVAAPAEWTSALAGSVGVVPGAVITIGAPLLAWFFLRRTPFAEAVLTVGDNDATAFSAGVRVDRVRICAYALGGLIAAVGGIALEGLIRSGDATAFGSYMLVALAAVALGGTNLAGGEGGLGASAVGATGLFLINNILAGLGVSAVYTQVAYGSVLVFALVVQGVVSGTPTREEAV